MRLGARAWASALVVGMLPAPAWAQSVLLRVTDASTAQPLQGALVVLTDPAGAHAGSALTDPRGRFLFTDMAPGTYTARAELIGFSTEAQTVTVGARGIVLVELRLEIRAIELEGLSVEGKGRCRLRPEAGLRVAEVWDEVRKALEAARWTEEYGVYEYRTRRYSHDVEEETGLVAHQESRQKRVYLAVPYESRPAEDLLENGFVQSRTDGGEGDLYFAPDASVLLSDIFLDSHCMRLRAGDGDEAGLVGLTFEPVRGRRIPDIAGTLWIDPNSWQLSHLEYSYENVRRDVRTRGTGGEVVFQSLPNGTWIVPEWHIRMPLLAIGRDFQGRQTVYQYGYREEGGTVLSIREPGGDVIFGASTGALEGVVLEELTSEPVAGAIVSLAGTEERVTTDAEGRFRFTEVVPGRYGVTFEHAAMSAYGQKPDPVGVDLVKGDVASVILTLPSPFALEEATCREELGSRPDGSAILVGRVTERELEVGLEGARVTIEWDDLRLHVTGKGVVSTTGRDGRYVVCVVPDNTLLRVTAKWGPFTTMVDTTRVPVGEPGMGHDIVLGVVARTAMTGTVRGWTRGEAVSGAEVRLTPLGQDLNASIVLTTDAKGRFALADAEVGLYVLEVSSLGYATVSDTVEARSGRVNHVSVRLPEEALEIEGVTVEVEARIRRLDESGFYQRKREGLGVYIDADAIEARLPIHVSDLLDRTLGVYIGSTVGEVGVHAVVVIRGCLPAVYIDGVLARRAGPFDRNPNPRGTGRPMPQYLDDLVHPSQIAGMEVYRSPAELPLQYAGTRTQCGVILIWTH